MHYIIRKGVYLIGTLFLIVTLTFFLMKAIPGDPFTEEKAVPKEILVALREHYGLNDPWYMQYGRYLKSILTWDLGPSFKYRDRTINEMINEGFPVSAVLGLEALFLALAFGISFGVIAALKHHQWQDFSLMLFSIIGISVPSFILAALLQYIFALKLHLFPIARWESFAHTILPAISLAMLPTAFIARLVRSNMLEVMQQDYIKVAKAKGLSTPAIVFKYGLRNAMLPVITFLGPLTANILVGSFIIEKIFGIPGLGYTFVMSVTNRDYTAIMGTTVFYSIILLVAIFFVDIAYGWLDPRMKEQKT